MTSRMLRLLGDAPLVFAGTGQAAISPMPQPNWRASRRRLIGSATVALASSVAAMTAMEAGCSADDVRLRCWACRRGFVVPWSEASIGGYPLHLCSRRFGARESRRGGNGCGRRDHMPSGRPPPGPPKPCCRRRAGRSASSPSCTANSGSKTAPACFPSGSGRHGILQTRVPELTTGSVSSSWRRRSAGELRR